MFTRVVMMAVVAMGLGIDRDVIQNGSRRRGEEIVYTGSCASLDQIECVIKYTG